MIFQHTLDAVLDESKTQTSRIVKPGDYIMQSNNGTGWVINAYAQSGRPKWSHGHTYAVQPGRGKKAVARIRILKIRMMDVRNFMYCDAIREGFGTSTRFWEIWCRMHDDKAILPSPLRCGIDWLNFRARPAEHYNAWVLNFELVK